MKKKLFMLSLALISCVCVLSGVAACTTDDEGNVTIHYHEMSEVAAVDATCTTDGNIAYWYCEGCGKYFEDYGATVELSASDVVIAALGHDYTTTFEWAEDYSTATATRVCSHDASHTETVTAVITSETTDATCTADGSVKYTATATFSDNETATDEKSTTIPATGEHVYSTDWSYNSSYHWQECTVCGEIADRAEHSYEITDDMAQCTVCGYVANEALGLDAEKTLTLIDGEANESGYATAASYLYYNTTAAGTYALTLTFDNSMVPYFVDIVVSVNGTVVTGDGYEYIVDLVEGMNYVEISYTGTGATIVLGDYTYTASLSAYVAPVTNDLAMGANTVAEYTTYTFKADSDGYYTFTVSETKGWAAIYSSADSWTALLDEYGKGQTSYTTQISAGSSITLYFTNGGDGSFVVTVTYSETNPDPNAVTTDVPATLAIGDNAIALSEEDGATGVSSTFTATEAGIYTFSISGDNSAYASLGKKYTISDRSLQVVYADDPQTYTLEANETITIYFYSEDDSEFTFNIVFGDTVSTDDDYLLSKTYTITTERDADYGDYRFKKTYIIKTSGTYTFTLDTTATTGTSTLYISNDGTLWDLAAELSVDGDTTATYELTEGNTVIIMVFDSAANDYVLTVSNSNDEPAHEHSYEATWNWSADYSSATVTFTCTSCGDTQTVTATVSSVSKAATCTEDGLTTYTATASFNGTEYTDTNTVTIPATGHNYEAVVTDPTCTEKGYTTYTCSVCGDKYTADETEAAGHKYETVVTAPTCTEKGYTTYTCSVCGDTYTADETEATGHTYGDPVWAWAEDYSTATATFTCSACNHEEEVTATITSETTSATCNDDGSIVYTATATFNDVKYTDTKTSAISSTGHTYGEPVWAWASDYSTATATFTCVNGDDTKAETATVTTSATAATCTTDGETVYTATVTFNGEEYTSTKTETIAATGHSYTAAWTWASDYSSATLTLTCSSCGGKQTFTVDSSSETDEDGNTVYTVTYTYDGETYTTTQKISAFDGTVYNISSLSGSMTTGNDYFDGFITAYTTSTASSSVTFTRYDRSGASTVPALVDGQTLYEGVVLTHCIRISGSASNQRGIQFTLSEDATVFIYYTINSTSGYLILTGDDVTYTITSATGVNTDIYMYKVQLTKGTYKLYAGTSGQYDLFSIGVDYNASTGTDSGDTCEHTYEASWTWASDYSRAVLTLTCSLCGDVQTFTVDSSSELDADGNTVYTITYTYEGDGKTYETSETVPAEDSYFTAGTYTVEPTLDGDYGDYRYSYTYTVKETGTYTIALDTSATTGSGTLYFSLDGTLYSDSLAAELSTSGETSSVYDLDEGGTITVLLYGDADAYTYVFTVTYSELCDHSFTAVWTWADSYTSADLTLTCSNCGMVITKTVEATSATADGYIVYTVSYTYNGVTYSTSEKFEASATTTFNGTIYDISGSVDVYVDTVINDGFTVIGSNSTQYLSYKSSLTTTLDESVVEYADINGNTVDFTTAISGFNTSKGLSFTLSKGATVIIYYGVSSTKAYLKLTNTTTNAVVNLETSSSSNYYVLMYSATLEAGTYKITLSSAMYSAYLYAIGISDGALYVANTDTELTLEDGYTWDSEVGDTGAYVYNPTEYELTGGTTYTLTVKDSGSYTFTAGNSDVTFGTTTIGANTSVTLDLYSGEEYAVTAVSDVTLTAQFIDVTGNASGKYDTTSSEYTFTEYSGSVTLAAGETAYYRIDAASQDDAGNTSFNMYIYVSGDVDNVSVYYSSSKDSENLIAAKDSYTLVTLTEGYYYITLAATGHGFFKIVADSAATITVELNEGGNGGTDDEGGDTGDSGDYVAMTLGETMTLDLLDDGNGYYVVYLSYTAGKAGEYTLTLNGSSSMWSQSSMLTAMLAGITVTVNGETVSSDTGVYTLSLVAGENTIVINYKINSTLAATTFTAALDGDDDSGDEGDDNGLVLGETTTLDLLDDGNGYYVVNLSYTATEDGSYTLTLGGNHGFWTSMTSGILSYITVTVNGSTVNYTVSGSTGVYNLSLVTGENTIVINYKMQSTMVDGYTYTALLEAA